MSLSISLTVMRTVEVFDQNITHNLGTMAREAGLYAALWEPETLQINKAAQLIEPLTKGLEKLRTDVSRLQQFRPPNGWGNYDNLVTFVRNYLHACIDHPDAFISISR